MEDGPRTAHVERVMGTTVSLRLHGAGDHRAAIAEAVDWFHAVDARFSPYRGDSEASRFGRGLVATPSPDLAEVVRACDEIEARSGGAFAARGPLGYDPSAYVKGWSVDRAAAILEAHGCADWMINAGGDVRTRRARGSQPWRIGIEHPHDPAVLAAVLPAWDLAVATSGVSRRGEHLRDPRTGLHARASVAVTVCGPELGVADALSTAAFVLGERGLDWIAGIPGYECWAVLPGDRVVATAGFPRFLRGVPVTVGSADRAVAA